MSKKVIIGLIAAILVIVGGILLVNQNKDNDGDSDTSTVQSSENTSSSSSTNSSNSDQATSANTITYTDNGFSPTTLTVTSGSKVTVKNDSSGPLQFDSNPHPEHTEDPELNIGQINPGESTTITVTATGSHGYHNHLSTDDTGTLIVN